MARKKKAPPAPALPFGAVQWSPDLKIVEPMIVVGMPFDRYLAHPAVSQSILKQFDRAPRIAEAILSGDVPDDDTRAMRNGRAVHSLVLEPDRTAERYAIPPDGLSPRSKAYEIWRERRVPPGAEIVSVADWEAALQQANKLRRHRIVAAYLALPHLAESSIFWRDGTLPCKARPDLLVQSAELAIVLDVKTTRDASPIAFGRECAKMGYDVQDAFYVRGLERVLASPVGAFVLGAVESSPPYLAATYVIPESARFEAANWIHNTLAAFAHSLDANDFPGYGDDVVVLDWPTWFRRNPA